MPQRRNLWIFTAVCAAVIAGQFVYIAHSGLALADFRAFYCGGHALLHGLDPYHARAIAGCERSVAPWGLYHTPAGVALPAPLPGYALAAFAALAWMPYPLACVSWFCITLLCGWYSARALARIANLPLAATLVLLTPTFALAVVPSGQLATVVICALVHAALALRERRWAAAAAALAVVCVWPHLALPALLAVTIAIAPMRAPVAAMLAVLAVLDCAAGGPSVAMEYVARVLPAHSLTEIAGTNEFGTSWVLLALGLPAHDAVRDGMAAYLLFAAAGIVFAVRLAAVSSDRAALLLGAPACALCMSPYLHFTEIAVAVPAIVWLHALRRSNASAVALVFLTMPFIFLLGQAWHIAIFAAATAAIARWIIGASQRDALRWALGVTFVAAFIVAAALHFGPQVAPAPGGLHFDRALAEASWARWASAHSSLGIAWTIAKIPTWAALLTIVACAATRALPIAQLRSKSA